MKNLITALALAWFAYGWQAKTTAPPSLTTATPIANHFIVQYHPDVSETDRKKHEDLIHAAAARHTSYRGIMKTFNIGGKFQGYHVEMDPNSVAVLQKSNIVSSVSSPHSTSPVHGI